MAKENQKRERKRGPALSSFARTTLFHVVFHLIVFIPFRIVPAQENAPVVPSTDSGQSKNENDELLRYLPLFSEVLARIKQDHVDSPETKTLIEGAIRGMLQTLDPYSQYYDATAYQDLQSDTRGKFGGVGMYIGVKESRLTVISAMEDTPAFRAGILAGDVITQIEGKPTAGMTSDDAANQLRGEPGTTVTITLTREGVVEPLVLTLTRDIITERTVKSRKLDGNLGYLRVSGFSEPTADAVGQALEELGDTKGLILDLRGNPGGLLSSAVQIASYFLNEGDLVVYTQGKGAKEEFKAVAKRNRTDLPLFVLVNRGSASASEILAGALRAHHRALLLGTTTFGKALVQKIYPLRESGESAAVKVTIAHYYTPDDVDIQKVGIAPDVELAQWSPLEARMFTKVRNHGATKTFLAGEPDDLLARLDALSPTDSVSPLRLKYRTLVDALDKDNIVLSDGLLKYAIAQESPNDGDEYEFDPQIQSAVQYLRAFETFRGLKRP